jgi:hypothetical protein
MHERDLRRLGGLLSLALGLVSACSDDAGTATVRPLPGPPNAPSAPTMTAAAGMTAPSNLAGSTASGGSPAAAPAAGSGGAPTTGGGNALPPISPPTTAPTDAGAMAAPPVNMNMNMNMVTIVPDASWDCGMKDGIPPPEMGKLVTEIEFMLGEVYDMGQTQFGHRLLTEIKGGTLKGMVQGTVMTRGLDWQLTLPTGSVELEQVNVLQAQGGNVYFRTCGVSVMGSSKVRIVPDFEAPNSGALAFLNTGKFAGYREFDAEKKTMKMSIYDIAGVTAPGEKVTIKDPPESELQNQTWDCKPAGGTRGAVFYTESVAIGGIVTVGQSKRGMRQLIPITGGTMMGKLAGTILDGGADFQLLGSGFILDARYTAKSSDGELIIVRNCGDASTLIPVFEAKKDGKYAFVAKNHYFSSTPSLGTGAVNITIYEGGSL